MDAVKTRWPRAASINSAPLVRLLAGLAGAHAGAHAGNRAGAHAAPPAAAGTGRWSHWLGWTDAIALSAVLNGVAPAGPVPAGRHSATAAQALAAECRRLRRDLAQAISDDMPSAGGLPASAAPAADNQPLPLDSADLAALRRHYQAHQRRMDERIGPLRARLRAALAGRSGPLAKLAALDGVLDLALAAQQRRLLASVPGWLEGHCRHQPQTAAAAADTPQQWQQLLLAELDLRLQPVDGLLAALLASAPVNPSNRPGPEAAP